jgi:hypothetical protein
MTFHLSDSSKTWGRGGKKGYKKGIFGSIKPEYFVHTLGSSSPSANDYFIIIILIIVFNSFFNIFFCQSLYNRKFKTVPENAFVFLCLAKFNSKP